MSDKALNITAIVLEFLSFWFVAPELLGVERLKKLENALYTWISWIFGEPDSERATLEYARELLIVGLVILSVEVAIDRWVHFGPAVVEWLVGFAVALLAAFGLARVPRAALRVLQSNDRLRQFLLVTGAILFTISIAMQLYLAASA